MKPIFETDNHSSVLSGIATSSAAQDTPFLSAKKETSRSIWYRHTMLKPAPAARKQRFIVRVSPFSLIALFIVGWFPYRLITGRGIIQNTFLEFTLLLVVFTYTLYADFIIRNFFAGKEKLLLWLTETIILGLVYWWLFDFVRR